MSKLNNIAAAKPPQLKSPPKGAQVMKGHKVKALGISVDKVEDFAMGRGQNNAKGKLNVRFSEERVKTSSNKASRQNGDDLESFFSMGSRSNSVPKCGTITPDPFFDAHTKSGKPGPTVRQRTSSGTSTIIKKSSSASGLFADLSSMFGAAKVFGEFEEVEGENEERRRARLIRMSSENSGARVADMNQRDMQSQQEQEERRRIAESVDIEIKRWAVGKEGNVRALLSSLHYVLWPECGWQPVSLTDMITSTSVKMFYRKANLCVHPDKVQQKGATLQQKYTAGQEGF